MKNPISDLYNAVSASIALTWDVLSERLQSIHEDTLLYNRMMQNTEHEWERLKYIVEKK